MKIDTQRIAVEVAANHAKLDSCKRHDFERVESYQPLRGKYRCKHCRGEIDAIAYLWFERGRAMA